jgi:hypothetical protein
MASARFVEIISHCAGVFKSFKTSLRPDRGDPRARSTTPRRGPTTINPLRLACRATWERGYEA